MEYQERGESAGVGLAFSVLTIVFVLDIFQVASARAETFSMGSGKEDYVRRK